jgi:hypothetical protein
MEECPLCRTWLETCPCCDTVFCPDCKATEEELDNYLAEQE